MSWIAWSKGLCHRAEVLEIARQLNIDPRLAAACCMLLWEWADDETENGSVTKITLEALRGHADIVTGVPGFGGAFAKVKWVISDENGIFFPNWDRYNGPTAKTRMKNAKRQEKWRKKRYENNASSVIFSLPTKQNNKDRVCKGAARKKRWTEAVIAALKTVGPHSQRTAIDAIADRLTAMPGSEEARKQIADELYRRAEEIGSGGLRKPAVVWLREARERMEAIEHG